MKPVSVRVWSDLVCPWATLALDTLHTAARDNDYELTVEHRCFPLELFNEQPTSKPMLDVEVAGIGGLRTSLGWKPWSSPDWFYPVTSLPALAAVRAVAARGGDKAADELDAALRRAFFVDSRCISMTSVIVDVARTCDGVDADQLHVDIAAGHGMQAVFDDAKQAREQEVGGSPQLEAAGTTLTNPGVDAAWSGGDQSGFLRLNDYDDSWAVSLLRDAASA